VFDGERLLDRPTVLVDEGAIVAAGVAVPESARTVDLADATLLPGLIGCHQHLCFNGIGSLEEQISGIDDDELVVRARASAQRALRGGVTTVRDLGDRGYVTLGLRADRSLPTILAAGPPITRVGGHCSFLGGTCTGKDDLRRAVTDRAERDCDVVKVMATGGWLTPAFPMWDAQFGVEELQIVVDEAHRVGLPVAAHCHGIVGIEYALDAGVDTIEHCSFFSHNARPEPDETLLARLASSGVTIAPTIGRLPDIPFPAEQAANRVIVFGAWRRLHELGATLVAGTDAGVAPAIPHDVLPYAFGDLIQCGASAIDGLRALTTTAARACGVADHKGRLARGFDADVIAVNGDPFRDADALTAIRAVWRAGVRVY
jgi:imidazolonepropionase-like amidohydrolase